MLLLYSHAKYNFMIYIFYNLRTRERERVQIKVVVVVVVVVIRVQVKKCLISHCVSSQFKSFLTIIKKANKERFGYLLQNENRNPAYFTELKLAFSCFGSYLEMKTIPILFQLS